MRILSKNEALNYEGSLGGKALGLLMLHESGANTPDFYLAVDFENDHTLNAKIANQEIHNWSKKEKIDPNCLWAVRSSAAQEDGAEKSFAGQYKTVLNVRHANLFSAIQSVFESYQTETAYSKKATSFGIVIQKMLSPDYSGVYFSKDPIFAYRNEPVINIIPGLGDPLVSGKLTGFSLNFNGEKLIYDTKLSTIDGEIEQNKEIVKIQRSSTEILDALRPHLEEIKQLGSKLEQQKGLPLDFEFAIENNTFYWLQVRPITTRGLNETFEVWDNTSVEANFEGLTLPLSISFITRTLYKAYGGGVKSVGFDAKVLKNNDAMLKTMSGGINGALYYNVTAWQTLLYQMPAGKKFSKKLPLIWGMEPAPFQPGKTNHSAFRKTYVLFRLIGKLLAEKKESKKYHSIYNASNAAHQNGILLKGDLDTLKATYARLEQELGDNWLAPVLNGFYTMVVFSLFKKAIAKSPIKKAHPNFVNDVLFSDGEVISLKLVRSFQNLLQTAFQNEALKNDLLEIEANKLMPYLAEKHPSYMQQIKDYIDAYGNRTEHGELKMETITYKNDSIQFLSYLKSNLAAYVPRNHKEAFFNYKKVLKEHYPINFLKRAYLGMLAKKTVKRVKARENYRFMRTETFSIIRDVFMQIGKTLKQNGSITDERDVLYLELDELMYSKENELNKIILERKKNYTAYSQMDRTNRYMYVQGKYSPVHESDATLSKDKLKGIGCCSGFVEGEVVILDETTDLDQDFNGKILVAYFFQPGWIGLFNQAIGIVSERGNLLSHTAIICRELNLPSIVGAKGLMKTLKSGQLIKMDGATGIINLNTEKDV